MAYCWESESSWTELLAQQRSDHLFLSRPLSDEIETHKELIKGSGMLPVLESNWYLTMCKNDPETSQASWGLPGGVRCVEIQVHGPPTVLFLPNAGFKMAHSYVMFTIRMNCWACFGKTNKVSIPPKKTFNAGHQTVIRRASQVKRWSNEATGQCRWPAENGWYLIKNKEQL